MKQKRKRTTMFTETVVGSTPDDRRGLVTSRSSSLPPIRPINYVAHRPTSI